MRQLPYNTDVESVMAIGAFLHARGKSLPVSITGAKAVLRKRLSRKIPERELEQLLVEMCSTRGPGSDLR